MGQKIELKTRKKESRKRKSQHDGKKTNEKNKKTKKNAPKQPQEEEEEEEMTVEDEDLDFFNEHSSYSSFLTNMDAKSLKGPIKKKMDEKTKKKLMAKEKKEATAEKEDDDGKDVPAAAASSLQKKTKKKKINEVIDCEIKPRKAAWENKNARANRLEGKLPVKSLVDGVVRPNTLLRDIEKEEILKEKYNEGGSEDGDEVEEDKVEEDEKEEEDVDNSENDDGEEFVYNTDEELSDLEVEEVKVHKSPAELKLLEAKHISSCKLDIAKLCEAILEDPTDGVKKSKEHSQGLSKLQQLHAFCDDENPTISQLAMLSELSIFLDILPDYRIHLAESKSMLNNTQKKNRKKTQELLGQESNLLINYQLFLKFLSNRTSILTKKTKKTKEEVMSGKDYCLAETAVKCLAELFKVKYEFNFCLNIIMALLPLADSFYDEINNLVCEALETVFQVDKSGKCSLDIVKQMSIFVKKKQYKVKERIIRSLVMIPLKVNMEEGEIARKKAKNDRKRRRKLAKEGDTIAAGLKEAEATVDVAERDKTQADILHELVLIYFRILKLMNDSPALPAVLEGLSKFALLINFDIMIDLMKVLKLLLKTETLPLLSALQAVLTGLRALHGPGAEMNVDEKEFIDILYKLLLGFTQTCDSDCLPIALKCVDALFLRRKEIIIDRVAAFSKRLLLVSLYLQPNQMLAVLAMVRSIFHKYSKLQQLLENSQDRISSGLYRGDIDDPDFSNPFGSACWELAALRDHFHPMVSTFADGTSRLAPSLPNETPKILLQSFNTDHDGEFKPPLVTPKKNPLYAKMTDKKNKKRGHYYQREFFVKESVGLSPFFQHYLEAGEDWKLSKKHGFEALFNKSI